MSPSNFLTLQLRLLSTLAKILVLHQTTVRSLPVNKQRIGLLKSVELVNPPQLSIWLSSSMLTIFIFIFSISVRLKGFITSF